MSSVDWFMASFLYCFLYSYHSSNYCDSNSCRSFALIKALVILSLSPLITIKSDNYRYRDSWKSDNLRKEAIKKEAKNWYKKDAKRIKSDNFTRGNREKYNIAIAILNIWMIGWHNNYMISLFFMLRAWN